MLGNWVNGNTQSFSSNSPRMMETKPSRGGSLLLSASMNLTTEDSESNEVGMSTVSAFSCIGVARERELEKSESSVFMA